MDYPVWTMDYGLWTVDFGLYSAREDSHLPTHHPGPTTPDPWTLNCELNDYGLWTLDL